ncbi:hypothetical protein [Nitrosomonas communis]|uniref:hypothetical protein n=1 Tax=Nitrosomonas communis TaxID=44574 RepID=UPI000944ABDE|nr:hypothetical protein [Nitrosomonas communis]
MISAILGFIGVCAAQQLPKHSETGGVQQQAPGEIKPPIDAVSMTLEQIRDLLKKQTNAINSLAERMRLLEERVSTLEAEKERL